ncbi:RlpA-like double-psi beta-barrel-protein domain-containing protein-containing protein, partial [Delphinella strobiligena]
SLKDRFDSVVPPHRTYLGLSRRWFLVAVFCITLALLALIIGLAVGLTGDNGSGGKDLPLPSNRQQFVGDLTYYGTGLGSCGITSTDSQDIVAVSHIVFDAASTGSDPNSNPLCGQIIRASRYDEEVGSDRSVDLKVVDRCTGCAADDLDVSPSAFASLAPIASGRVDVTWAWL